jgi:cytochrome c-type biogenesis protein CcmH/NrfG
MKYIKIFLFILFTTQLLFSESLQEQVIKLINMGSYDEAIKLLESNEEQQNDVLLAIAYIGKKDFKTAKVFALQYWLQKEDDVLANYLLAFISEELKEYDTALVYWENVLKNTKETSLKQLAKRHINVLKRLSQ